MNKGTATVAIVALVALFGFVGQGLVRLSVNDEGRISKVEFNEQTKTNGQIIWCKMQGKTDCE